MDPTLSKHFCILPWAHAQLSPTGEAHPCCKTDRIYSYGSLREEPLETLWNAPPIRALRRELIAGRPASQCTGCYHVEELGGRSLRQDSNEYFREHLGRVDGTDLTGAVQEKDVPYLNLRFSNLCNFRCRMCDARKSTGWYADARALGEESFEEPLNMARSLDELRRMLEPALSSVQRIYFGGGEPLLHKEHYWVLDRLIELGRTDVVLDYNTNLSRLGFQQWDALELWSRFKTVYVGASLDGVGAQGELLRKGMSWTETKVNFKKLRVFAPHALFIVDATMSAMNVFHITDAISEWLRLGMVREPWSLRLSFLEAPSSYRIQILNEDERSAVRERYAAFLAGLADTVSPALHEAIARQLGTVLRHFAEPVAWEDRERFRSLTLGLDRLRGESFAALFPEHAALLA